MIMSLSQHVIKTMGLIFLSHFGEEIDMPISLSRGELTRKYDDKVLQLACDLDDQGGEALSLGFY